MRKLNRIIRDNIRSKLAFAEYGYVPKKYKDAFNLSNLSSRQAAIVHKAANRAIRIHDSRYNDIVGSIVLVAALRMLVPILVKHVLKEAAVGAIEKSVIKPILVRLIEHFKNIIANRGDASYLAAFGKAIKKDFSFLLNILKKEGSTVVNVLSSIWRKITGLF